MVITTDASLSGWGAECQGTTTQGQWSEEERTQHINVLELKAAELALKSFIHLWQGSRVRFRLDNTTAASQILKMGSPRSLRCLVVTQEIWEHVLLHKSTAIAQHLPGKENVIADQQSRVFRDSSIWRPDSQVFAALRSLFPLIQVDLFADRLNHQLARYWSWHPDPHAEGVDALTTVWNSMRADAFPLFRLVHRILKKVQDERSELLLVAPVWGQQPWYPLLLQILTDQPVLIPMSQDLLKAPDGSLHPLCVNSRLVLAAWPVSGNPTEAGLSAKARALVGKARCAGTVRAYRSGWNKFHSWCGERKINPVSGSVESIVNFLADQQSLVSFGTSAGYRSAIMIQWRGLWLVSIL